MTSRDPAGRLPAIDPLSVFAAAAEAPEAHALVVDGASISWRALAAGVARACDWLRRHASATSIAALQHAPATACCAAVSIVAAPTREAFVFAHAFLALGVPLAPLHPRLTEPERRTQEIAAGAAARIDWDGDGRPQLQPLPNARPLPNVPPDRLPANITAYPLAILHTSGSSGAPRAVELSRAAFAAAARASAANLGWRDDDRWLLALPWAHVGGLSILTRALAARRAVVLPPPSPASDPSSSPARFDPAALLATIARDRVTLASLVPAQLARLLDETHAPPPPHLRALLVGGAATPAALLAAARRRGWPALATWGLTEACAQVATQPLAEARDADAIPDPSPAATADCGPPLPGLSIHILDDHQRPLPTGNTGRIAVAGPTLLTRYRGTGTLPASLPAPCPSAPSALDPAARLHVTGDLGWLDARGRLHVLGRADDVIITGGEKVAPAEVEAVLAAHPAIAAACVFAVAERTWGQLVAAAVVLRPGAALDDLRAHVDAHLAPHKRPRRLARLDALPGVASGKVNRRAVAAACADRLAPW